MISLSDNAPNGEKDAPSDWRPLNISTLERFRTEEMFSGNNANAPDSNGFQMLYEHGQDPVQEDFQLLYQRERSDSDPQPSSGTAGETAEIAAGQDAAVNENQLDRNIEARMEQGYSDGFAKGEKEGYEAGLQKAAEQCGQFEKRLKEIDSLWEDLVKRYEKEIVQLVCRTAEKVVLAKVECDPETVKRSILHAFEMIPEPADVTINLHPDDYEFIELIKDGIFEDIKGLKNVEVVSNPSVGKGGCSIETRSGNVSLDIEDRLERVRQSLIEAYQLKEA